MIREKRTVNCWLLTKSKRKKGKERRKRKGGKEEERKKKREEEEEKRERRRKKKREGGSWKLKEREEEKTKKAWKEIKATAKGNLQKPLQLPFILPIELITAFFNFQKLISSGSASKQNYMMHTGHSCNFIDPFRCITSLSEARPFLMHYRPFWSFTSLSEAYLFRKPKRNKTKKGASRPQLRKPIWLPLRSKLLSNAEIFISNSNLNAGIYTPKL